MADEIKNPTEQKPLEVSPETITSVSDRADGPAGITTDGKETKQGETMVTTGDKVVIEKDTPAEPPKVATPETDKELQELMTKKNFKSPNDVAKSYISLEKKFHQRNQTNPQGTQIVEPPALQGNEGTINDKFLQDLMAKPIETMAGMYQIMKENDPEWTGLKETRKLASFESEIMTLSRDEETKDVLTAEMSTAIGDILKSRPYLWESPTPVADAYFIAKATLSKQERAKAVEEGRRQAAEEAARANRGFVETGKSAKETIDTSKLSASQLKERLKQAGAVRES